MQRGLPGRLEITVVGDERIRAFVPCPLPPAPPVDLSGPIQQLLERAALALGRLDSVSALE